MTLRLRIKRLNPASMNMAEKLTKEVIVSNNAGIHLRVGAMLAKKTKDFQAEIKLRKGSAVADCRSVIDILSLGAFLGDQLVLEATGEDAEKAIEEFAALFEARFYEDEVDS